MESHIPNDRLRRLVKAAYVRADAAATRELREWAARYPEEAKHAVARDGYLRMLLADALAEGKR